MKKVLVVLALAAAIGYALWHLGLVGRVWGTDPCKLLTKQDAEAALGGPVRGPYTKAIQESRNCGYGGQGSMENVTLNIWVEEPCDTLTEIADPGIVEGGTRLGGIGEEAVAWGSAVYVRKKKICFDIIAVDYSFRRSDPIPQAELRKLAETAAARIP